MTASISTAYDPTRVYGKNERVPAHGARANAKARRRRRNRATMTDQRGVAVAGTGKISASGDKSLRKKKSGKL